MPYSVNGFGTGLVKSSRKRVLDGHPHFDAIEAVQIAYVPLLPYKALHIVSHWQDAKNCAKEGYQSFALRPAPRIMFKALLNGWGNALIVFGGGFTAIAGLASYNMERPFNQTDLTLLCISSGMVIAGIVAKLIWWKMDATDYCIKDIIGRHPFGISDPYYWSDETADAAVQDLLEQESLPSLLAIADRSIRDGDRSKAMLCVRLAMRNAQQATEARLLMDRLR